MYFLSLEERKYQRKNRRPFRFFASNFLQTTRNRRVCPRTLQFKENGKNRERATFFLFLHFYFFILVKIIRRVTLSFFCGFASRSAAFNFSFKNLRQKICNVNRYRHKIQAAFCTGNKIYNFMCKFNVPIHSRLKIFRENRFIFEFPISF